MLEHVECPNCHAPNLTTEVVCFACGRPLRSWRKRRRSPDVGVPWPLWIGLVIGLAVMGLVMWHLAAWLAGRRERAALPAWYLPTAGGILIIAGQVSFRQARGSDLRWWRLCRASELKLSQASAGDTLWTRGRLECDTPLYPPYVNQPCAYYRYIVRERDPGEAGWRETDRGSSAVDFRLADEGQSVYVPSGHVLFDAPLYVDAFADASGIKQVRAWALPVGLSVSLCGLLVADGPQPRMDPLGDGLPVVATWRSPRDYVARVARGARTAGLWGWLLTFAGAVALVAGVTRL